MNKHIASVARMARATGTRPWLIVAGLAGCSGDGQPDAAIGPPSPSYTLYGRLLDWDSPGAGSDCPIVGATLSVRGKPSRTTQTDSEGKFGLIYFAGDTVDVIPPSEMSQCSTPPSIYRVSGVLEPDLRVLAAMASYDLRAFTVARTPSGYDSSKAQVLVRLAVPFPDAHALIDSDHAHDPPMAFDGTTWAPGSAGEYVYFPNITPTGSLAVIGSPFQFEGGGNFSAAPGTLTYVEIH